MEPRFATEALKAHLKSRAIVTGQRTALPLLQTVKIWTSRVEMTRCSIASARR
jgi:hypothetical protein